MPQRFAISTDLPVSGVRLCQYMYIEAKLAVKWWGNIVKMDGECTILKAILESSRKCIGVPECLQVVKCAATKCIIIARGWLSKWSSACMVLEITWHSLATFIVSLRSSSSHHHLIQSVKPFIFFVPSWERAWKSDIWPPEGVVQHSGYPAF